MKTSRLKSLCLVAFILISFSSNAQNFLSTEGQAIVDESGDTIILRGMGLGGWMLQEGYMLQTASFATAQYQIKEKIEDLIGEADTEVFYEAWENNHCRKIDIDSLKAWGFNSVRLPMHYKLFTLPIEEEPVAFENTWLDRGFELTDSLISWCAQNDMWVILDLHGAPGGQGYDQAISDYNPDLPSLWESAENRAKCVALWKRIADRYKDEQWVAGYDLLNETNWNLPGGSLLRSLYNEIIDSIRTVDSEHIIIIEGNWFANDFTGLTPPWDDNLVYGPHKYWSFNNPSDIQWVIDIRDTYNVPLYFGESGENSNVWFRDAIKLFEDHGIGWAWWPMKKVESISGPLSITKNSGYQSLLSYWENGGTTPTATFAKNALMQFTEDIKLENCVYQKDVIDAMFRQVYSDETIPYAEHNIPGIVYATDFDMGVIGEAYYDVSEATYHVSSGQFTAWNEGWQYRNDAVGCEVSNNSINANGYNVGFIDETEWMQYEVNVAQAGLYDVHIRAASVSFEGAFRLQSGNAALTGTRYIPYTNGSQIWQTVTVPNIYLSPEDTHLRWYSVGSGYNIASMEFEFAGASTDTVCIFTAAQTLDQQTVQLDLNKPLSLPLPAMPADFEIFVNGDPLTITDMQTEATNARSIIFTVDHQFLASEDIRMNYNGTDVAATDATLLENFTWKEVENNSPDLHEIPGRIQAEAFESMEGIQLESTTDTGGGENIGYLDVGDYLEYLVLVDQTGTYSVNYRTASESAGGGIKLFLMNDNGTSTELHEISFPSTGGWQDWTETETTAWLPAGQRRLRVLITESQFNVNWFEFEENFTSVEEIDLLPLDIFPNPSSGQIHLKAALGSAQNIRVDIFNIDSKKVESIRINNTTTLNETIDLSSFGTGTFIVTISSGQQLIAREKVVLLH